MENVKENRSKILTFIDLGGYIFIALGLFLALYKRKIVPQDCYYPNSGNLSEKICVDEVSKAYYDTLAHPAVGWCLFGIGVVLVVTLMILKAKKVTKNPIEDK